MNYLCSLSEGTTEGYKDFMTMVCTHYSFVLFILTSKLCQAYSCGFTDGVDALLYNCNEGDDEGLELPGPLGEAVSEGGHNGAGVDEGVLVED
jgi:hypothetical protein